MLNSFKTALKRFAAQEILEPIQGDIREIIYERLFDTHCRRLGVSNDFYPIGSAANYSLMLLLLRILDEFPLGSIVELGSGQSTILIDRLRPESSKHVCFEDDRIWHERLKPTLRRCDYRLSPLVQMDDGQSYFEAYADLSPQPTELLLVDGPVGVHAMSRYGCIPFARDSCKADFVIIVDDVNRAAEAGIADQLERTLGKTNDGLVSRAIVGSKSQRVIAAGRFAPVIYLW